MVRPAGHADASSLPLVTIVSPSLNQGQYIEEAIRSVLAQDYPRVEYIVVDGGSTDGTLQTLKRFGDRLRWISEPDTGQAAAINKGLAMGSGEILAWLNCDDYYEAGAVSRVVRHFLDRPDLMLVYGDARFVDDGGRDLGPCRQVEPFDLDRLRHYGDFIVQPAAFFRREAFEAVSGLDETLHWTMDYDLWIKIGQRFPVLYVTERLASYRLTGENKTATGGEARFEEIAAVGRRHGADGLPAVFRIERLVSAVRDARSLVHHGRLGEALRTLGRGLGSVVTSKRALGSLFTAVMGRLASRAGRGKNRGTAR